MYNCICVCSLCGSVCFVCVYVDVVLHQSLEDEVGGRRIDSTCDRHTPSTKSKNTWLFPAETHMPCKAHPQGLHRSFIPSLTDADSAGPSAGCSGSDKSPPSRSAQFPGERYAINSHSSGQSAPRQRDTGDVGAPGRGPNAVGGPEQASQRRRHPTEPRDNRLAWDGFPGQPKSAVDLCLGLPARRTPPLLQMPAQPGLLRSPSLLPPCRPPSVHPPSKALQRRGLF